MPGKSRGHLCGAPVSLSLAQRTVEALADTLITWNNNTHPCRIFASLRIRTAQIIDDVVHAIRRDRNCLVMAGRTEHVDQLAAELNARGLAPMVLHGSMRVIQRSHLLCQIYPSVGAPA